LLEGDWPGAVSAEAETGAAVIVGERFAVEGAAALQAVEDDGSVIAEHFDLKLGPSGVMELVAGREDHSQDSGAVEDLAVGRDVNVLRGHEPVHGGGVVLKPRRVPGFAELDNFLLHRCGHVPALRGLFPRLLNCDLELRRIVFDQCCWGLELPAGDAELEDSADAAPGLVLTALADGTGADADADCAGAEADCADAAAGDSDDAAGLLG
jgi:hypothetical protein